MEAQTKPYYLSAQGRAVIAEAQARLHAALLIRRAQRPNSVRGS
jgi:hypothetical protein